MHLLTLVVGFALDSPIARRLATNNEPCKESCDSGYDRECDTQDPQGGWTISCDLHPTTSCDDDCHPYPSPPMAPWLGAEGTYPSPPPPPPPPDQEMFVLSTIYIVVVLILLLCYCIFHHYNAYDDECDGNRRNNSKEWIAWWCCCLVPWLRAKNEDWDGQPVSPIVEIPKMVMIPLRHTNPPPKSTKR